MVDMIVFTLSNVTPAKVALILLFLLIIHVCIRKYQVSKGIMALGGRSPEIPTYLPFAIDFIYKYMKSSSERRDIEFWNDQLAAAGKAARLPYCPTTAEFSEGISSRVIFTTDPENIKAILSAQFADYGKGERFHDEWKEFIGDSVFGIDGQEWSYARQMLRPLFKREKVVDTEVFEKHVQKLIPLLGCKERSGEAVDIAPLFLRFTLDVATDFLLGQATNTLDDPKEEIAESFRYVLSRQSEYFRMDEFSWLLSRRKFRQELAKLEDFIQPYIQKAISLTPAELDKQLSNQDTFLHSMARSTKDARFIRDQLLTILLAGRDTTAATLSFCVFELARNPSVTAKLRKEIEARLGVGPQGPKPTFKDLKEMSYLNAVLNETMRVYPVVPLNLRYSLRPTTLPRGGGPDGHSPIGVRPNTRVIYSTMLLHKRPDLYPSPDSPIYHDPARWLPDRWSTTWKPNAWEFIPFNKGQRACIGQQFATVEMAYTLCRIFQTFEGVAGRELGSGGGLQKELRVRVEVTMSPDEELNCEFVEKLVRSE